MRGMIRTEPIRQDEKGDDVLYCELDNGERYMECLLSYDSDAKKWVILSNDSEVARL